MILLRTLIVTAYVVFFAPWIIMAVGGWSPVIAAIGVVFILLAVWLLPTARRDWHGDMGYYVLALMLALTVATGAFAEDAAPTQPPAEIVAPAPAPAPSRYYLELEPADLQAISQAINELPKRVADPLVLKLNGQLQAQTQVKEAAEKAKGRKNK